MPDQKELESRLWRGALPFHESRQHVERDGHQLERDEQQYQFTGRDEHHHPQEREEEGEVILGCPADERALPVGQRCEHAECGCGQHQALGEDRQAVLDVGAAEDLATLFGREGQAEDGEQPDQRDPAESPALMRRDRAGRITRESEKQYQDTQREERQLGDERETEVGRHFRMGSGLAS